MDFIRKIRRNWKAFIVIAICIGAGMLIPARFAVTTTPSLDHRVFFITSRSGEDARRGDYVMIELAGLNAAGRILPEVRNAFEKARETTIIKRVACASGDFLHDEGMLYFCNGAFIGEAKERTLAGAKTSPFRYAGRIPAGRIFVTGDHKDSYDSRYFGFIRTADVGAVVLPVL